MIPQLVFLLCFGKLLPKPNLTAWPTSVVPPKSKVTLRCRTSIGKVNFALRKEGDVLKFLQPPDSAENQAEFPLNDLQHHNSGNYTCEYYRRPTPYFISPPSDVLLLLVTGNFTKPSLQAHPSPKMTLGGNVTLQCQKPSHVLESARFILLKEGNPEPIQHMSPVGNTADFSLQTVTFSDTGNYSCVYYQTDSPFMASNYSNSLEIQVTAHSPVNASSGPLEEWELRARSEAENGRKETLEKETKIFVRLASRNSLRRVYL
ncbi:T-cell-interacting, activating receptor on myeloid cells protein 1-like [Rhynchocyon petersi]